jgi:hypothetical protein
VRLMDSDGFVLLGPGSEWLWLAVAGIVLAATFVAIYRQLRMQRHAAAIEQLRSLDQEWLGSERMARLRVAALETIRDRTESADIPPRVLDIADFWEGVGHLVRGGHLDAGLVGEQRGQSVRMWWGWMAPILRAERERREAPWIGRDFEWLAGRMAELDRSAGRTTSFDDSYLERMLPSMLAYNRDMVALAEESRGVRVAVPGAATTGIGASPAAASVPAAPPRRGRRDRPSVTDGPPA